MASRRFTSTLGAGTGTGAAFAIAATACLNDAGTTATAIRRWNSNYNRIYRHLVLTILM